MNFYKDSTLIKLNKANNLLENMEQLEYYKNIIKDDIFLREFYCFFPCDEKFLSKLKEENNNEIIDIPDIYFYYPFFEDNLELDQLIFNKLKKKNLLINYKNLNLNNFTGEFIKIESLIFYKNKFLNNEWFCFEIIFNNLNNIPNYYFENLQNKTITITKTKIINKIDNLIFKYGQDFKKNILYKRVQNRINKIQNNNNLKNNYDIILINVNEIENLLNFK